MTDEAFFLSQRAEARAAAKARRAKRIERWKPVWTSSSPAIAAGRSPPRFGAASTVRREVDKGARRTAGPTARAARRSGEGKVMRKLHGSGQIGPLRQGREEGLREGGFGVDAKRGSKPLESLGPDAKFALKRP